MRNKYLIFAATLFILTALVMPALSQDMPPEAGALPGPILNIITGDTYAISDVFVDPDAAISVMESIAVADMEQNGNAYLENREATPLPADRWEADEYGLTVRYPADRLSTFSGRPGAYHFFWYELDGLYNVELIDGIRNASVVEHAQGDNERPEEDIEQSQVEQSQDDSEQANEPADIAVRISLPGLPAALGDDVERLAMIFGGGKESDFTADAQVYQLEDARFRGVKVLTSRDDPTGTGPIIEIRAKRLDYHGLWVGVTQRSAIINARGEPSDVEIVDEDAAYDQLLPEGAILWYDIEGGRLGFLVDNQDTLSLVILRQR